MFKIYQRTIHIGTPEQRPNHLEYQVDEKSGFSIANVLAIPAMIAGVVVGTLGFSVFFAVLLIPMMLLWFRAWRLMKSVKRESGRQTEGESINAEYTVVANIDKP